MSSFWMYFCSCGCPTRPSTADANECPMSGTVPRNRGAKFFALDSLIISAIGFSTPVDLRNARCCFSIMRTGLMKGALRMDAAVAAMYPGSVCPVKAVYPSSTPNLGTRLKSTPMSRGHSPDRDAVTGLAMNTAFASLRAIFGSTAAPDASLANCCTYCRYAVTGLSPMVWMADPPRYAHMFWNGEMPFDLIS